MIIDLLDNAEMYYNFYPYLKQALKYLKETNFPDFKPGKFDIDGTNLYGMINEYETIPKEKGVWEAHRKYTDVQFILQGQEMMGYAPIGTLKVSKEYQEKEDYLLLEGSGSFFTVKPGMFVVFGPEDGHQPGLAINSPSHIKKVVLKVRY
ncbi:MAG: YhcH/YjgK/YiaL family protein [Candidatus Saganbacteria bacterium]|nr:YhcH/YjgK/YiaL family protein [Candidatus Saganbacteria bacterium]